MGLTIYYWLHQAYIDHFFAIFRIMDPCRNVKNVFAADLFDGAPSLVDTYVFQWVDWYLLRYVPGERCIGVRCVGTVFSIRTDTCYIKVAPAMFRSSSFEVLCISPRDRFRNESMANPIGKPIASVCI